MDFKPILLFLLLIPISLSAIENLADTTDTTRAVLDSLEYSAEKIIYNLKSDQIKLIGNSEIFYKDSFIKSDSILIDLTNRIAISRGKSELFDGEESIFGSTIFYDIDSEEGMLLKGNTEFEGGFYSGKKMRKVGDRTFDIDNAKYTTCDLKNPHYYIFSPKFRVFLNDKIIARPVILYVNHFPIFALPFATFPIKRERHSGFLIPDPGYNKTEGKTLKDLAYFQTFGNYGDILFALDFMELTGLEFRIKTRYLKRYILQGNINSRLLYYHEKSLDRYKIRWTINTYHKHTLSPFSDLTIKTDFVSDAEVRKTSENKEVRMDKLLHSYLYYYYKKGTKNFNTTLDYKEELIDSNRTFYSKTYFSKKSGYTNFNILGDLRYYNDYRKSLSTNRDKITLNLPSISFQLYQKRITQFINKDKEEFSNLWDDFYISYKGNLIHKAEVNKQSPDFAELFYHDTYNSEGKIITQHREGIKHSLSLKYERKLFGFLSFWQSVNYNEIWVDKDKENKKLVRGYDYNEKTNFYAPLYGIFSPNFGRLKAIRHIIFPKISFTMQPDFSKNDRFKNTDNYSCPVTISSTGRSRTLSFLLENKLQAKILGNDRKIKKLNNLLSVSSSLNYDFERKPTGFSDIKHTGKIMTIKLETGPTKLNLNTNFSCTQDYPSLKIKDYSYKVYLNLSIGSDLLYFDYFPYQKLERNVNERLSPRGNISDNIKDKKIIQKPWSLDMKFGYGNNKAGEYTANLHNHLRLYLTKNWSIDYNNYYNFKEHKLVSQGINIYRDLHCWQLRFTWSKSGEYWSYRFQINAKKLPDLKFRHSDRKHW